MRISVGSDHRGVHLKARIVALLRQHGHEVDDAGTDGENAADYPDFAECVGQRISRGEIDRGILICGTGIGMAIVANKFPGGLVASFHSAITRRHNDINVLCLSADLLGQRGVDDLVTLWMATEFEGGRHARRIEKIRAVESRIAE
jgi:ribose 5-phosphate isomerase B